MCTLSPRVSSQPCLEAQGSAGFVPCVISGTFALVVGTAPVSAAEMFSLLCSPLGQGLVRPCIPKPQPAGSFTACLCPLAWDRTRLRQHQGLPGGELGRNCYSKGKSSDFVFEGKQVLGGVSGTQAAPPPVPKPGIWGWGRTHLPWGWLQ